MQESEKNASILIWTIFLSIIISMAFLGISTKIHKNIKNSGDFVSQINSQNAIQNDLKSARATSQFTDKVYDNILVAFEDQKDLDRGLNKGESTEIKIQEAIATNIEIRITSGGPIQYKYINSNTALVSSGVIHDSGTFSSTLTGSILLKNLGGHTNFSTTSDGSTLLPPAINYNIKRRIGNLDSIQSVGKIINFIPGDF